MKYLASILVMFSCFSVYAANRSSHELVIGSLGEMISVPSTKELFDRKFNIAFDMPLKIVDSNTLKTTFTSKFTCRVYPFIFFHKVVLNDYYKQSQDPTTARLYFLFQFLLKKEPTIPTVTYCAISDDTVSNYNNYTKALDFSIFAFHLVRRIFVNSHIAMFMMVDQSGYIMFFKTIRKNLYTIH